MIQVRQWVLEALPDSAVIRSCFDVTKGDIQRRGLCWLHHYGGTAERNHQRLTGSWRLFCSKQQVLDEERATRCRSF
ncbi:hypothetical protein O9929_23535 [Vibrio lentus]|nr:hypothetical protein [Vibrio lentus]